MSKEVNPSNSLHNKLKLNYLSKEAKTMPILQMAKEQLLIYFGYDLGRHLG